MLGLSWGLVHVRFFWTLFSVSSGLLGGGGGGGGGDWFSVWFLFLLLLPVRLAVSWAARVAVSVWCLAMVVFTRPVRVEFLALVRLWWVVSSRISWSRTFWCLSSASTWLVKWSKASFTRSMLALSRIYSHCSSTVGVLFRRVHSSWWEFSCQGHLHYGELWPWL